MQRKCDRCMKYTDMTLSDWEWLSSPEKERVLCMNCWHPVMKRCPGYLHECGTDLFGEEQYEANLCRMCQDEKNYYAARPGYLEHMLDELIIERPLRAQEWRQLKEKVSKNNQ